MTHDDSIASNGDEYDALAGEYVLGTLDDAARRDVERRLPVEPELRHAVARWETRLAPYTDMVEPLTPPPNLWQRIERSVADRPPRAAPVSENVSRWTSLWRSLTLWRGVSFASLVTALGLAAVLSLAPAGDTEPRYMVVLMTPQHSQAGWVVQAASRRDIELIPLGESEIPPGKTLQFWTKADDWSGPVSLGLVRPGETQRMTLDDLPPLQRNQLFELTLEDAGGSPLDRPTGPIQFIGRAVSL